MDSHATYNHTGNLDRDLTHRDYAALAALSDEQIARDCRTEVFHAHGPGGQGVNTSDSAVRMRHLPTGITVTSRESRSQFRNREICVRKLREEFARRSHKPKPRKATKPSRRARERRLRDKHMAARKKASRRKPAIDD